MPEKKQLAGRQNSRQYLLKVQERTREKYILKLYVSGMTLKSTMAIQNIQRICQKYLAGRCDLEIIDIFQHPDLAKTAQIIAVPTLIKKSPLPVHRMIGDMSHTDKVLIGLDLATSL